MQRVRPCPAGLLPGSSSASDGPARLHRQHQRALLHSSRMSECPSIQALETGVTYRTSEEAKHVPPVFAILDQREHAIQGLKKRIQHVTSMFNAYVYVCPGKKALGE